MSEDRPWIPCNYCRLGRYQMRLEHWMRFDSVEQLERHLRDNMPQDWIAKGHMQPILSVCRHKQRIREMERGRAPSNPGLTAMFEAAKRKRQRQQQKNKAVN